jgi:hypothetical protein
VQHGAACHEATENLLTLSKGMSICTHRSNAPWDVPSHVLEIDIRTGGRKNSAILETGYLSPHLRVPTVILV